MSIHEQPTETIEPVSPIAFPLGKEVVDRVVLHFGGVAQACEALNVARSSLYSAKQGRYRGLSNSVAVAILALGDDTLDTIGLTRAAIREAIER